MNPQSERSKRWLEEALLQLMQQKHFSEITVTDITAKAGLSRLTFYRNFDSKEEVLLRYFDAIFQDYLRSIREEAACTLENALCRCFEYWQTHKAESELLMRDDLSAILYKPYGQYLDQVLENVSVPRELSHTQKRFIVGGLYFVTQEWLEKDGGRTAEDMAREVLGLMGM